MKYVNQLILPLPAWVLIVVAANPLLCFRVFAKKDALDDFEIELRRWPRESGKALTEGWEERPNLSSSARPIKAINLQGEGFNYTLDPSPNDIHATFHVRRPAGKTQIATTMMAANDKAMDSTIYMYLRRLSTRKRQCQPDPYFRLQTGRGQQKVELGRIGTPLNL